MKSLKEIVNTHDKDGKPLALAVLYPTYTLTHKQQLEQNKAFKEAIESGCILREALDKHMRSQNLWDDEKQKLYDDLNQRIADGEDVLASGGIKLSEARKTAVLIRLYRMQLRALVAERINLDAFTAQGQAENRAFNWLLSQSVVDNESGALYFKDVSDYYERNRERASLDCAKKLAEMIYGLPQDYEKNLPENQFLIKYKLVDEQLRLVNSKGELVDLDNKRIDENGNYVDDDGNIINPDKKDTTPVEFKEFLDDDGNPVAVS